MLLSNNELHAEASVGLLDRRTTGGAALHPVLGELLKTHTHSWFVDFKMKLKSF